MQQIVFNGHYLTYADSAMMDFWRALALPYALSMQALGGDLYVRKATLEYHASAQLDDQLDIGVQVARLGRSSLTMTVGMFRDTRLLVSGELIYVFADPASQTSQPIPPSMRGVLDAFAAGEAMSRSAIGSWNDLGRDAGRLRRRVFVQEQGFGEAEEWDGRDEAALHAVVYNRLGEAIATGRLLQPGPGLGRIGRVCVEKSLRGGQFGAQVMAALEQAARQRGDRLLELHAQCQAEAFYRRIGYVADGEPFDEEGVPHILMVKPLQAD